MYIGRIMRTDLITVSPTTNIEESQQLINKKKISHLLVVSRDGDLVGILSDRDFKKYAASPANSLSISELQYLLKELTVGQIMTKSVITLPPDATVEEAATMMQRYDISALPVQDNGKLIGIVTSTDIIGVLLQTMGVEKGSVKLIIFAKNTTEALADITNILKQCDIPLLSFSTWPEREYPGVDQIILRVPAEDANRTIDNLQKAGHKVMTRFAKDISPFLPE